MTKLELIKEEATKRYYYAMNSNNAVELDGAVYDMHESIKEIRESKELMSSYGVFSVLSMLDLFETSLTTHSYIVKRYKED